MAIPSHMVFPEKCQGCPHFVACWDDGRDFSEIYPSEAPWKICEKFKRIEEEGLTEKMPDFGDPPCHGRRTTTWTTTTTTGNTNEQ